MEGIMRCFVLCLFMISSYLSWGQNDTVYFDKDWKKTERGNAKYVRTYELQPDHKYKMEDRYIENNKLQMTGYCSSLDSDGIKDGPFVYFDDSGSISSIGSFVSNKKTGDWKNYYKYSKQIWHIEYYKEDKLDGELKSYYKSGKLKRMEMHHNSDTVSSGACYDENSKEIAFTPFITKPKPRYSLADYLMKNLRYPDDAREYGIEGRVTIKFTIHEDGSISDGEIVKSVFKSCDQEALRVISKMPPWKPGLIDDTPEKVYFIQSITFNLE